MEFKVQIEGMKCDGCAANVKEHFSTIKDVEDVQINREEKNAIVTSPRTISKEEFVSALAETSYEVTGVK